MVSAGANGQRGSAEAVQEWRVRCGKCRDLLSELARIHLTIDPPTRRIGSGEPDWICRLRKVCLHVLAINAWEIGDDVEHVMAVELRAAYVQMDVVWKCLPRRHRLDEVDGDRWDNEARNGLLATYDHPTPMRLRLPNGGFGSDRGSAYLRLSLWLTQLGFGYQAALSYLAEVLGSEEDVEARIARVLVRWRTVIAVPTESSTTGSKGGGLTKSTPTSRRETPSGG